MPAAIGYLRIGMSFGEEARRKCEGNGPTMSALSSMLVLNVIR